MKHLRSHNADKFSYQVKGKNPSKADTARVPVKRKKIFYLKDYLLDYIANSNLHGLKYIGEKERTWIERVFWLVMFTLSVIFCGLLIRKVYTKWNESPVIVTFAENPTPVWQIPYPAITICSQTKSLKTKFNYTYYYYVYYNESAKANLTEEEINLFEAVSVVCDTGSYTNRNISSGYHIVKHIREISPNLSSFFEECQWNGKLENCSHFFFPIVTEEGICYTFNTLSAEELFRVENLHTEYQYLERSNPSNSYGLNWSLDDGYYPNTPLETYPHRGLGNGINTGIELILRAMKNDFDYICKGPIQGFKIHLHNPAELPRIAQQYVRMPLSQELVVAIKPKLMFTSNGLKPYPPSVRQCYFPKERYLRYFKVYTQANCEMECLTNFSYVRCGCVHIGMPHGPNMDSCSARSSYCLRRAKTELVTIEVQSNLQDMHAVTDRRLVEAIGVAQNCKCLPACTSIEYEAETSLADLDWRAMFNAYQLQVDTEDTEFARVMIFFKEAQFITSRRSELYGQTDFLANCGGLLGLFMGFSVLSVTEIFYFLTLRLCCMIWRKRHPNTKQDKIKD